MATVRRALAVAVAVPMALMSLSGCYPGPDPVQYAALTMVNDRPTAVVAACGRSEVTVQVFLNDDTKNDDLHLWSVTVTLPHPAPDVEVELLGAARPGWEITTTQPRTVGSGPNSFEVVPLTSIEPGHHYTLDSSTAGPEGSMAPGVTFTTEDLRKIGAGQVLAPADHKHSEVVPRDSFVKDRCR